MADRNYGDIVADATGVSEVILLRSSVDNFFANLGDAWSAVNLVLQAKPVAALETGMRFVFNSTLGLGGLFDIAGDAGMERRYRCPRCRGARWWQRRHERGDSSRGWVIQRRVVSAGQVSRPSD